MVTEDKGSGEVILFLHGYLSCKESFRYQLDFFSKNYRVIAPDLTGFGENLPLSSPYSLDDYCKDVLKLLSQLKIQKYHVIAHSFGARIAIKLANTDSRIDKIIITGGAGIKPKRSIKYYFKVYLYKILKKIYKNKDFSNYGSKEYKSLSQVQKLSFIKIVNEHLDVYLPTITNKTLLVYGKKDTETPVYMAKKLNKGIKDSKLVLLNGSHFCFIEQHGEFNKITQDFLKENN